MDKYLCNNGGSRFLQGENFLEAQALQDAESCERLREDAGVKNVDHNMGANSAAATAFRGVMTYITGA